jgi:hypothetical protein
LDNGENYFGKLPKKINFALKKFIIMRNFKDDLDNHANQLNPNNDAYWQSRGYDKRPENWQNLYKVFKKYRQKNICSKKLYFRTNLNK